MSIARRNAKVMLQYATIYPFRLPENSMTCAFCESSYENPAEFRKHSKNDHLKFNPSTAFAHLPLTYYLKVDCTDLRCRLCGKVFEVLRDMAVHLKTGHGEGRSLNLNHDLGLQPFKVNLNRYSCVICQMKFYTIRALSRHTQTHFVKFTCEMCGKSYASSTSLNSHFVTVHTGDGKVCRKCKTTFDSLDSKKDHLANSPKCWLHSCNVCGERFMTPHLRKMHLVKIHGNVIAYKCPECTRVFSDLKQRRDHFIIAHTEYNFSCSHCDRKFTTKSCLERHRIVHTGAKSFTCDTCSKSFTRKWYLEQHMSIHKDRKNFECVPCAKYFALKSSWSNHMKNCRRVGGVY